MPVGTRLEIQVLEDTVEIVHDSDVVAVGEHVCLVRSAGDAQASVEPTRNRIVVTRAACNRMDTSRLRRSTRRWKGVADTRTDDMG